MIEFLHSLLDQGLAVVSLTSADPASADEMMEVIRMFDQRQRSHLAGTAPPLDPAAAIWAAEILYEAVRFLAARDDAASAMEAVLMRECPVPRSAAVDYSVDLFFHQLPEVHRMASRLSAGDPLIMALQRLAAKWPLSSVGMPVEPTGSLRPFLQHSSLEALYVDRILETDDTTRLADIAVREAVEAALGAFPELCPKVARHLNLPALQVPL